MRTARPVPSRPDHPASSRIATLRAGVLRAGVLRTGALRTLALAAWVLCGVGEPPSSAMAAEGRSAAARERAQRAARALDAAGAVDGVKDGGFGFHTSDEERPWWQVDLETVQSLDGVRVYNRSVAADRALRLVVSLSLDGEAWVEAYRHDGTAFGGIAAPGPLDVPLRGAKARFVRLTVEETTWLHLDEVEVHAAGAPDENIARGRPATQSSVSQWSRRPAATPRDARLEGVRARFAHVDPAGLRRAIEDLAETFPHRYLEAERHLARLRVLPSDLDAIDEGLLRGDDEALAAAEAWLELARDALLSSPLLDFDRLLLVARPESAPSLGLPANFHGNEALPRRGHADRIVALHPPKPDGEIETLLRPPGGFAGDVDLHFDGRRLLFSSLDGEGRWRVFEVGTDGRGLRPIPQIEDADVDNYDACYLPSEDIVFGSTATFIGVPCVFGASHVANLYRVRPSTGEIRRLTFDQDHDWCPTLLPSGRVLYLRWEYTDLAHPNSRILFSMNPDGTQQAEYFGSNSYFPNSFFYARPVPGPTERVVGIATGHHGTRRSGRLLLIDPARGRREADPVVREIPGRGKRVEATVRDRLVDGVWPQFLHPWPLGDPRSARGGGKYFLVSARLSPSTPWGIYLVDVFDNITLVRELPGHALFEPVPLRPRRRPPPAAERTEPESRSATVYMVDVHAGGGLDGVPRGEVTSLRVLTYYYGSRGMGGLLGSVGMDGPWDIRWILGTVPVEEDGSALFTVPANLPIAIQPLDAEGQALQLMRSWFTAMPGETLTCVGCHESQNTAPPNRPTQAAARRPSSIRPWFGPPRGFAFSREVQPVLDRHCVSCHDGGTQPDLRGTPMAESWRSEIAGHVNPRYGGKFSTAYANLHRFVRRPGIESDLHMLSPLDFHADTTELAQILRKGHHGVALDDEAWSRLVTWIDLNAPYHGTWSELVGSDRVTPVIERRRELLRRYGNRDMDFERVVSPPVTEPPDAEPARRNPEPTARRRTGTAAGRAPRHPHPTPVSLGEPTAVAHAPVVRSLDLGDGASLDVVLVPSGRFVMGSQSGHDDEAPPAVVEVHRPFWLGRCEVTNEQYARFDPSHDSRLESRHGYQFGRLGYPLNRPRQPVVRVSWHQAMGFCRWLSERTGERVTLPTEAQWEHACRAGTSTDYSFGGPEADYSTWANLGDQRLREYAACTAHRSYSSVRVLPSPGPFDDWVPRDDRFDDGSFVAAEVGAYRPNPWGLHDLHGNVWEWTLSDALPYPYREDDDRSSATSSGRKIVRGGSWYDRPKRATASYRLSFRPYQRVFHVGFRIAIEAEERLTASAPHRDGASLHR